MNLHVGTSGYSYETWREAFYPSHLPAEEMLAWYASRLSAVEINNTFYRMPKTSVMQSWASQVPAHFRFAIKAPRRITHIRRLREVGEETQRLLRAVAPLKQQLGALLFQLPPRMPLDLTLLGNFLALLPPGTRCAFEFRDSSWWIPEVYAALHERGHALCLADTDAGPMPDVMTAGWGYVRLRRQEYSEAQLAEWAARLRERPWSDVYVFFKHEEAALATQYAARLRELAGLEGPG